MLNLIDVCCRHNPMRQRKFEPNAAIFGLPAKFLGSRIAAVYYVGKGSPMPTFNSNRLSVTCLTRCVRSLDSNDGKFIIERSSGHDKAAELRVF